MPTSTFAPHENDVGTFRHRYYKAQGRNKLPRSVLRESPAFWKELVGGDHHERSFYQVRDNNSKNGRNVVTLTGTYAHSKDGKMLPRHQPFADFGRANADGWQVAIVQDDNLLNMINEHGYRCSKLAYPTCFVIAGVDVDLEDAVKFLISLKAPYDDPKNLASFCGGSGTAKGNGKRGVKRGAEPPVAQQSKQGGEDSASTR